MVSREINLLSEKRATSTTVLAIRRILSVWTPLILGSYLFILATTLITSLYFKSRFSSLEKQVNVERNRIQALENSEGTYLLLKQKAGVLKRILDSRFPYSDLFAYFQNLKSFQGTLKSLHLDSSGNLTVNFSVPDSTSMEVLFNGLLSDSSRFSQIELESVVLKPTGGYDLSLAITSNVPNTNQPLP